MQFTTIYRSWIHNKKNKHFYSLENKKPNSPRRRTTRGSAQSAILPARVSWPPRGPRRGAAQPANGPRRGRACARRQICTGTPEVLDNLREHQSTISSVYRSTTAPSHFYFFTAAKSLAPRARTGATARALSDHAGLTRTSTAYLRGR